MTNQKANPSGRSNVNRRSLMQRLLHWFGGAVSATAWLIVVLWVAGRIFTDQYLWSQWLWWVPTPAMLLVCLLGLLGGLRTPRKPGRRRTRLVLWGVVLGSFAFYFAVIENRFFSSGTVSGAGVVVAHWNLSYPGAHELSSYAQAAGDIDADVLVLSSAAGVGRPDYPISSEDRPRHAYRFGIFTVVTELRIIGGRPLVNRDGVWSFMIELDTSETLGSSTILYMVDLPSDRGIHRLGLAEELAGLLEESGAPSPDIVVGDFNIPRGSRSLSVMFPELHHAWNDGGHGYSATFHREYPYTHIDHVLLSRDWLALSYEVVDPGIGRHRVQRVRVVAGAR